LEKIWWFKNLSVSLQLTKLKGMKNDNKTLMILILILSTGFISNLLYRNTSHNENSDSMVFLDSDTITTTVESTLPNNFVYTYSRFKVFNPDLDSSTVFTFNKVCGYYDLDTTTEMLGWCVGQILLESGAKQYHQASHPKAGQLVRSSGGAIGIAQILPSTAYGYLKKYVTTEDAIDMASLGCTPFDFIVADSCSRSSGINLSREWLKDETNNLILWGYIMRRKLNQRPNILKVLITYNAGTSGMNTYVNNGGQLHNHKYVKGIKKKLNYADKEVLMTSYNH